MQLNEVFLQEKDIIPTIQKIIKSTIRISDVEILIQKLQEVGDELERTISNLIDVQVKNPNLPQDDFNSKYQSLTLQFHTNKTEVRKLEGEHLANYDTRSRLAKMEASLNSLLDPIQEVDGDTLLSF